jgi:hypothetical protein
MNAQDVILGSRVAHVRELKAEIERLRRENAALHDQNAALGAHFDLALLAAEDLRNLASGGVMHIWDGWNLILGARKEARDRENLAAQAREHLAANPQDRVWIVYDGSREAVVNDGRLRISYTGGCGEHRADRFICDYLRMANFQSLAGKVRVRTNDRDFRKKVKAYTGI